MAGFYFHSHYFSQIIYQWNKLLYILKDYLKMLLFQFVVLLFLLVMIFSGFFLLNINLLYSAKDMVVKAHGKGLVPTDLSVAIPKNCYGRVGMIF